MFLLVRTHDVDKHWLPYITPKTFTVTLLGFGLVWLLYRKRHKRCQLPLPPGPKKLPVLGNALSLPKGSEWKTYAQWSKEHKSGIIHIQVVGQSFIVINSLRIARELLEKRAIIYSGRPSLVMINEIMGCDYFLSSKQYGKDWKQRRSLFRQEFHPSQTPRYQPYALRSVREHLHLFLDDPENFSAHLRRMVGSAAVAASYGIRVRDKDDPYILTAEAALNGLTAAQFPGRFLVEVLPILKYVPAWVPGAEFKRLGAIWAKKCRDMVELPFAQVKRDRSEGHHTLEPSFASRCLDAMKGTNIEEQELIVKESVGVFYLGAVDTSSVALHIFFLAMILYPEVQQMAQEELDRVLPPGQLPDFTYESSLPYITAIVKEVLRWHPVTPVGLPHRLVTDDIFEGYYLPGGSIVIANTWAILHDEQVYADPEEFIPERFLKDGQIDQDVRDPSTAGAFGFGRRICPGAHMARSMIWISIASILRTMTISKARDETGEVVTPVLEFSSATISYPAPFKCVLQSRSNETKALIRSATEFEVEI